jgi:arylsulfatase A-like enzyme
VLAFPVPARLFFAVLMKPIIRLLVATILALATTRELLAQSSSDRPKAPDGAARPNILFIISDDQRPDTIGALGNPHIQTPHLDRLVREGTVLSRAIAAYPICSVSRAEILTGATAFRNGAGYRGNRIEAGMATWPATMARAGYRTGLVGKWDNPVRPAELGFAEIHGVFSSGGGPRPPLPYFDFRGQEATGYRGYTFKDDLSKPQPEKGVGLRPDISRLFADAAIELIQRQGESPFFIQLAFTTPHDPLLMPPGYEHRYDPEKIPLPVNFQPEHPFDHGNAGKRDELLLPVPRPPKMVRENLAVYYAAITYMDEQIGRVLDFLRSSGKLENTVVIFTSDQGLAQGSHGLLGKQNMYEHSIGVPLIVRGPGIPAGQRRMGQCYLRDLFPTACALAGAAVPETVEGKSVLPLIRGEAEEIYPHVVSYFTDTQRAIRTPEWKYIEYPQAGRRQLFNLQADPAELQDRSEAPESAAIVQKLRGELIAWLRDHHDPLGLK